MDYLEKYALWLKSVPEEDPLHRELEEMQGDDALIRERFMKDIAFGTAGLRGILGAGTSCMNRYTVGRAAQGIANLICEEGPEAMEKGVVIAHDPRHGSKEFSGLAAEILAGAGIRVYTFPDMRPTPELAYMIRKLGTVSGINITASHNPKEYNGFKAYWEDGCQVSSKVADAMEAHINAVDFFRGIRRGSFEEGVKNGGIARNFADLIAHRGFKGNYHIKAIGDEFVKQMSVNEALSMLKLDSKGMVDVIKKDIYYEKKT